MKEKIRFKGRVYVIDDDASIREHLSRLLSLSDIEVEAYSSAAEFAARGNVRAPACAVVDIAMPDMSGLQLQDVLLSRGVDLPIIFITGHGDVPTAVGALKKGAVDFVEKPFNSRELIELIKQALGREEQRLVESVRRVEARALLQTLSVREREVMELVVVGKRNKIIADQLGIAIKTVEAHRAKVMEKMKAKSVAELVQAVHLAI